MRLMPLLLAAVMIFAAAPASADQDLAGHRVAYEFEGNTVKGEYRSCGLRMDFFEYYDASGAIRGKGQGLRWKIAS